MSAPTSSRQVGRTGASSADYRPRTSASYDSMLSRVLSDPLVVPLWEKSSETERILGAALYERMLRSRVTSSAISVLGVSVSGSVPDLGHVSTSPLGGWIGGIVGLLDEAIEADRVGTEHDLLNAPFPAMVPESWFAELANYRDGGEQLDLGFFDEE